MLEISSHGVRGGRLHRNALELGLEGSQGLSQGLLD